VFVDKADKLMDELTSKVLAYVERDLATIHKVTGLEQFVVGGSWASSIIAKVINEWDECSELDGIERLELAANDLDVYHGPFTANENAPMVVNLHEIKKYEVPGMGSELNTVRCHSLSALGFLANNDINVTASCCEGDFTKDDLFFIKASPLSGNFSLVRTSIGQLKWLIHLIIASMELQPV
jgi:hypothetical protein